MRSVLRLSGSGTIQILIGTASYVGLVRILSVFGSDALAGYTIGIRIIIFALLPAFGISNAAATMVGQNLGAGRPDRAERAVWTAAFYNMIFLGSVGRRLLPGGAADRGAVHDDPAVLPFAVGCLRTVSLGFVFYAFGMVLTQAFNGAGDTWTPTLINLGRVLAVGDPAGVVARGPRGLRPARRVHRADGGLLDARGRQRGAFPPRDVEGEDRLGPVTARVAPDGFRLSSGTSPERRPWSPAGTSTCGPSRGAPRHRWDARSSPTLQRSRHPVRRPGR